MKIAWYTPYSANSAIAHFSQMVVEALRRLDIEVLIVRSEQRSAAVRAAAPLCKSERWAWASDFGRSPQQQLAPFDLVVYNIGDHYEFHAHCYLHQNHVPGLSILHDYSLHNAANHFCHDTAPQHGTYREQLASEHGRAAADEFQRTVALDQASWWQDVAGQYPIYRWALRQTLGVVTHAQFYRETVERSLGCPTATIPLAYDSPWQPSESDAPSRHTQSSKLTLLTVGAVNRNKRYESIIRAISQSKKLCDRLAFRIVGDVSESVRQEIESVRRAQPNLADVTMTGYVDRATLSRELEDADILSCLRYPALEGASASVIEALLTGKPVITCRTGCYAEIPDDLAFHVDPKREQRDLVSTLQRVVDNYEVAQQRATRARTWAIERHSADAYVKQLLNFVPTVLYNEPVLALLGRVANQFSSWNLSGDPTMLGRVDSAILTMFGNDDHPQRAA